MNVVGLVTEFDGLTQIDTTVTGGSVADGGAATAIEPHTGALPGTDCALPGTACLGGTALAAVRRRTRASCWPPSGAITVTDAYDARPSAATPGDHGFDQHVRRDRPGGQLDRPAGRPDRGRRRAGPTGVAARTAYNKAARWSSTTRRSITYWNTAGTGRDDLPFPWSTADQPGPGGCGGLRSTTPLIYSDSFGTSRLIPVDSR